MYDHILIPTDGSIETEQAVSHGLGLARTYDATVHTLYVTDESEFSAVTDASAHEQLRSSAEKLGRRATTDIAETAAEFDLTAEHELRQGTPYEEILDYVDEQDIDLVAMGTHGQAGVGPDLGSTTLRVVRNADVPVLTVRFREDIDVDVANHYEIYDNVLVATDGSDGGWSPPNRASTSPRCTVQRFMPSTSWTRTPTPTRTSPEHRRTPQREREHRARRDRSDGPRTRSRSGDADSAWTAVPRTPQLRRRERRGPHHAGRTWSHERGPSR
ncbi:universal stress protein [Haloarculaceae archaeon H-GB2-1]|nr:universal stress protein [Haloarculaceae archaeon H-GB11]MEA5409734.1 universal stress protein [Haloarculaceae archaeon H-GB2-1]